MNVLKETTAQLVQILLHNVQKEPSQIVRIFTTHSIVMNVLKVSHAQQVQLPKTVESSSVPITITALQAQRLQTFLHVQKVIIHRGSAQCHLKTVSSAHLDNIA